MAHLAFGQTETTGAIRGTVTDPQGAVLPTATITVTSQGTSAVRTAMTDKDGQFTIGLLPPGVYGVTIAAPGFKTENPGAITVIVTETARVDAKLELGSQSETVNVSAAAAALQVENAAVGTVVDGSVIQELPLANRNYTEVLTMTAGITGDLNSASTLGKGTPDVYVNGASSISNNFHMDGADINNFASGRAGDFVQQAGIPIPDPDALQEYKIQTTQYDAGYGRDAGANVDVITRSGTNDIHGSLWEFFRNDIFNANDTFLKISQLTQTGAQRAPDMKQNMFGGTIGGRIIKDKLFYFGSYQGTRQINGFSSTSLATANLFPLTDDRSPAGIGKVACPSGAGTATPAGALNAPGVYWHPYDNNQFSGNVTTSTNGVTTTTAPIVQTEVKCDGSNINPVAMYLLTAKLPNGTYRIPSPVIRTTDSNGNPTGHTTWSIPSTYFENQYMANVDYVMSPRNTVAERFFFSHYPEYEPFDTSDPPGNGVGTIFSSLMGLVKLTSQVNPHFLNEGLVAFIRSAGHLQTDANLLATQIGMTAPSDPAFPVFPNISTNGSYFALGGSSNDESSSVVNTFEISDQISFTHGKQSIRAGFLGEKNEFDFNDPQQGRGTLTFDTIQDFMLGLAAGPTGTLTNYPSLASVSSAAGNYYKGYRGTSIAMFIQDDYKLRSNLTLNLGFRWELMSGVSFGHGEESSFWPSLVTPFQPIPAGGSYTGYIVPNNYTGPMPAGLTKIGSRSLQANDIPLHNVGPRIGFAWQPLGASTALVVRGGVGIFYTLPNANSVLQTLGGQPFISSASLSASGGTDQTSTFQTPFTAVLTPNTWQPLLPGTATKSVTAVAENSDAPAVDQMNLQVQQQLPKKVVLEVGYVGTRGTRLAEGRNINRAYLASPSGPINGLTTNSTAAANIDARHPYQGLSSLTEIETYGFSWYNSLQTTVRRQLNRGFYVSGAYTWSKAMTTVTGGDGTNGVFEGGSGTFNDPDNRHARYGVAGYDRTNRLVGTYTYSLPSWKNGNHFEQVATGGWKVSGATTFQSGKPLNFTDSRNGTAYGTSSTSYFAPGMGNRNIKNTNGGTMLNRVKNNSYLNPSGTVFAQAPAVAYSVLNGTASAIDYGNVGIGAIRATGNDNWDMALAKTTRVGGIREAATLDFRAEFFNAFNHPEYSSPATGTAPSSTTYSQITSSAGSPRLIQLALRYIF
jgi:hypothetical protein